MATPNTAHSTLSLGYKLLWYEILAVLGQGSFGVTYLAFDANLHRKVAIKEYMPLDLAARDSNNGTLHPLTSRHEENYRWGLDRFITESRTLAHFTHPNIVSVYMIFEENNTAYMVMEYEQGEDLSKTFKRGELTSESALLRILLPLLKGLEIVHASYFIHCDIKPANIYLRKGRTPVLIDFGSARQALGNQTQGQTVLVTPGFAPYEQYSLGELHQGPWTDIYALGATAYMAISGKPPTDALNRQLALMFNGQDQLEPAIVVGSGRYSTHFLTAIDCALRFNASDRPQSAKEFRDMLLGGINFSPPRYAEQAKKERFYNGPQPKQSSILSIRTQRLESGTRSSTVCVQNPGPGAERVSSVKNNSWTKRLHLATSILGVIVATLTGFYIYLKPEMKESLRPATQEPSVTVKTERQLHASLEIKRLKRERQEKVDSLVAQANESFGKTSWRFTFDKYQEALAIDSQSQQAQRGLTRISSHHLELAKRAIGEGDLLKAREFLVIAETVIPDNTEVRELEQKINELDRFRANQTTETQRGVRPEAEEKRVEVRKPSKPKIATVSKLKPLTKEDLGQVRSKLAEFKRAYEQMDLKKLQQISTMSTMRLDILRMVFREYDALELSISDFAMISSKNSASATITILKLTTPRGDQVIPAGHWRQAKIALFKKDSKWGKINW